MPQPPLALCVPCKIITIHDGDTATHAQITLDIEIRYLSCWAPEVGQPGGAEATASAKKAEGKSGRLLIPLDKARNVADLLTFGRVLGEFWPDGQDISESQRLVQECHAGATKAEEAKLFPTKEITQ